SPELYFNSFLDDGADAVDRLIQAIRARKDHVVQQWHTLYSSRFGAHRAISEQLFQETWGPNLRTAVLYVIRGDTRGFISFAASVGEQLATDEIPFAAMVSHLNLWKESCARALADDPEQLCNALILLDKLGCCFVSSAADGYYRRIGNERPAEGG